MRTIFFTLSAADCQWPDLARLMVIVGDYSTAEQHKAVLCEFVHNTGICADEADRPLSHLIYLCVAHADDDTGTYVGELVNAGKKGFVSG